MKAPVAAASAAPAPSMEKQGSLEKDGSTSPVPEPDVLVAPFFSIIAALDNKKKYLEARAEKLQKFDEDAKHGKKLTEDKEKARLCLPDVKNQLGFVTTVQKKVMEKQREFNKKNKQRNQTAHQEKEQLSSGSALDALTAQYVLCRYVSAAEESPLVSSFSAQDRLDLNMIATFFLPEMSPSKSVFATFEHNRAEISAILNQKSSFQLWDKFNGAQACHLLQVLAVKVHQLIAESARNPVEQEPHEDVVESSVSSSPAEPDLKAPAPSNTPVEMNDIPSDPTPQPVKNGTDKITFGYFSDSSRQSTPPSPPLKSSEVPAEKPAVAEKKQEVVDTEKKDEAQKPKRRIRQSRPKKGSENGEATSESADKETKTVESKPKPEGEKKPRAPRSNGAPRGGNHNNGQRRPPRDNRENGTGENSAPKKTNVTHAPRKTNNSENGTRAPRQYNTDENETRAPRKTYNGENGTRNYKNYKGTSAGQKNGYNKDYSGRGYARENNYKNECSVPDGYVRHGDYVRPLPNTCGFTLKVQH